MKLIQITHDDAGKHYVYKCEVCGATLTEDVLAWMPLPKPYQPKEDK